MQIHVLNRRVDVQAAKKPMLLTMSINPEPSGNLNTPSEEPGY